jgi:hypothetical protein
MAFFQPQSFEEIQKTFVGPNSGYLRMVLTYWEMAAALVNNGAIDRKMFLECNGEFLLYFSRIEPFLPQLREMMGNPEFLANLEKLSLSVPNARQRLDSIRERMRKVIEMASAQAQPA